MPEKHSHRNDHQGRGRDHRSELQEREHVRETFDHRLMDQRRFQDQHQPRDGCRRREPQQQASRTAGLHFAVHDQNDTGPQRGQRKQPGKNLALPDTLEFELCHQQLGNRLMGTGTDDPGNHQPADRHTGPGPVTPVEVCQAVTPNPADHQCQLCRNDQQHAGCPRRRVRRIDTKDTLVNNAEHLGDTVLEPRRRNHRVACSQQQQGPGQYGPHRSRHDRPETQVCRPGGFDLGRVVARSRRCRPGSAWRFLINSQTPSSSLIQPTCTGESHGHRTHSCFQNA